MLTCTLTWQVCMPKGTVSCMLTRSHACCAGGEIVAAESVKQVFETGRGPITLRGRAYIEENGQVQYASQK